MVFFRLFALPGLSCFQRFLSLFRLEKKYNLPHLHAHAFRHTYASILAFGNVDIPSISNALGHANVSTTENIYSHVFDRARERNALVIEDALKLDSSSPN